MGKCFKINNIGLCQFLFSTFTKHLELRRNQATRFTYLEGRDTTLLSGPPTAYSLQPILRDKTII